MKVQSKVSKQKDPRFTPGSGHIPPVLAGREKEKSRLRLALDDLAAGLKATENIALIGPRGNGKTALLRWVELYVDGLDGKVKCIGLNPNCFNSYHDLVAALADPGVFSDLVGDGFSATINVFGSEVGISCQGAARKLLKPVLEKRCSRNGLAILIDEAHTLNRSPDVARAFLHDLQELAGNGRPLLLILAGTPSISARLAVIEATYWDRLNKIGIGLLDYSAAREAIQIPLERLGYCIESGLLDRAATAAQRYPYFLQIVGDALHRVARAEPDKLGSGKRISDAILESALKEFHVRRRDYYAERYQELEKNDLLPASEFIASIFKSQKNKPIPSDWIKLAIRKSFRTDSKSKVANNKDGISAEIWETEVKLRQVGFVWSQIGQDEYCEPGIPSLMDYVTDRAFNRERSEAGFESMCRNLASVPDKESSNV